MKCFWILSWVIVITVQFATMVIGLQEVRADYMSYISGTNPVGWWGMNEGSSATATADLSGAYGAANNGAGINLDLTYQGAGLGTLPGQPGYVNNPGDLSTYVDGSSTSGAFGNSPSGAYANPTGTPTVYYYGSGFSTEAWIKADGVIPALDSERVIATREFGLGFEVGGGTMGRLHFTTFGKLDYFSTALMPSDGQWHQIGVSWNATGGSGGVSEATFYIDGVLAGVADATSAGSGLRTPSATGANSINLAHRNIDSQHFKGWIDEAVIWGAPRTAQDFADSYAAATTAVPEPASVVLLAVGALGLVGCRWRPRKRRGATIR
jgi:hypothetical protein